VIASKVTYELLYTTIGLANVYPIFPPKNFTMPGYVFEAIVDRPVKSVQGTVFYDAIVDVDVYGDTHTQMSDAVQALVSGAQDSRVSTASADIWEVSVELQEEGYDDDHHCLVTTLTLMFKYRIL